RKNKAKQFLEILAFNAMQENQVMINGELVCNAVKEVYRCDREDIVNYIHEVFEPGLLYSPNFTSDNYEHCDYYFPHLTFQEFFTTQHISKEFLERGTEHQQFILNNKHEPKLEVIWWFVSGLLSNHKAKWPSFYKILAYEEPNDILGLSNLLLKIRCRS